MDRSEERILLLAAVGYVAGVMSFAPVITKRELARQLGVLGVQREGVLLVHSAFSKLGPVEDGPRGTDRCSEKFGLLDDWLGPRQRRGIVCRAEARASLP
jgi:hypothetical protein